MQIESLAQIDSTLICHMLMNSLCIFTLDSKFHQWETEDILPKTKSIK